MTFLRRPTWFAVALTVAGILVFVRLGMWQLDRASEKDELLRRFAAGAAAGVEEFGMVAETPPDDRYPRLDVHGSFVRDRYYLLDDQTHAGQLGVHVYAPFAPRGHDRYLLVDLGFLPKEGGANPRLPPLPTGDTDVHGLYVPPPGVGIRMGGDRLPEQRGAEKTVIYVDLKDIAADLGHSLYPRVLLMDADPASIYARDWTPGFMPPARHRAYAFQWFTFALAAVVIFVLLHRKRR
ncbi:SURF1 family protein [Luteibacter sp. UNCMF366Tsu5.1]|uniref:SURF1 family protein n=1 Tax=Luteibacter sp. UNCMF366Tsu5.1 TaxID=1502758 RepID=UPI000908A34F|nr:SURF1 family protein [Luteibacter sp. UNCMF366Tsu5.1]SFW53942.1 Cytochrome oxidase assembly protein ShyY1 [Luteibacter sp. UNCMF366Tsu5.1]